MTLALGILPHRLVVALPRVARGVRGSRVDRAIGLRRTGVGGLRAFVGGLLVGHVTYLDTGSGQGNGAPKHRMMRVAGLDHDIARGYR